MSTIATLVVGRDGSTTKDATSRNISSSADRASFLNRRRQVDVIIIGGNTARSEPYSRTPVPLLIEGGARMIVELVENQKIDQLELSITEVIGGENILDWHLLLSKFKHVEMQQIEDTQFFSASN